MLKRLQPCDPSHPGGGYNCFNMICVQKHIMESTFWECANCVSLRKTQLADEEGFMKYEDSFCSPCREVIERDARDIVDSGRWCTKEYVDRHVGPPIQDPKPRVSNDGRSIIYPSDDEIEKCRALYQRRSDKVFRLPRFRLGRSLFHCQFPGIKIQSAVLTQ